MKTLSAVISILLVHFSTFATTYTFEVTNIFDQPTISNLHVADKLIFVNKAATANINVYDDAASVWLANDQPFDLNDTLAKITLTGTELGFDIYEENYAFDVHYLLEFSAGGATPAITTLGILTAFTTTVNIASAVQTFTVSGTDLTTGITVTAPAHFEVALTNSGVLFGSSVNITQAGGTANAPVYVRYKPTAAGSHSGNISLASTGATAQNIPVSGTAANGNNPSINYQGTLTTFTATVNTISAIQSFSISAANLTANISITTPSDFQVATTNTNSSFANSIIIGQTGGTVNTTVVYVRYAPIAVGSHSGNISMTTTGATAQNVPVSGTSTDLTGIDEQTNKSLVIIYPNPARELIHIIVKDGDIKALKILDISGRTVYEMPVSGFFNVEIPLEGWNRGVYFIQVKTVQGKFMTQKIVVE